MTADQLGELFTRFADDVYRFAYSCTRHAADAEDPDTELERIVRSKLGLLCAHEGIGPRIEP